MDRPTFNQILIALDVLLWLYEDEQSGDPVSLRHSITEVRDRLDYYVARLP